MSRPNGISLCPLFFLYINTAAASAAPATPNNEPCTKLPAFVDLVAGAVVLAGPEPLGKRVPPVVIVPLLEVCTVDDRVAATVVDGAEGVVEGAAVVSVVATVDTTFDVVGVAAGGVAVVDGSAAVVMAKVVGTAANGVQQER